MLRGKRESLKLPSSSSCLDTCHCWLLFLSCQNEFQKYSLLSCSVPYAVRETSSSPNESPIAEVLTYILISGNATSVYVSFQLCLERETFPSSPFPLPIFGFSECSTPGSKEVNCSEPACTAA